MMSCIWWLFYAYKKATPWHKHSTMFYCRWSICFGIGIIISFLNIINSFPSQNIMLLFPFFSIESCDFLNYFLNTGGYTFDYIALAWYRLKNTFHGVLSSAFIFRPCQGKLLAFLWASLPSLTFKTPNQDAVVFEI